MKEYRVEMAERAQQDLRSIVLYIRDALQEPTTAQRMFGKIQEEVQGLCCMPGRHPLWEDEPWHSQGLHKLVVKKYVVLYLVDEQRQAVQIARIFYGGRDIAAQLQEG